MTNTIVEKQDFKFEIWQEIFINLDGEVSRHRIRGFYSRPDGEKIYVIVTYWRESLVKEKDCYTTLMEAVDQAVWFFEDKRNELNWKIIKVQNLVNSDVKLTEEKAPHEIAKDQEAKQES